MSNYIQACLLFDEREPFNLDALVDRVRSDLRYESMSGAEPGVYYALAGGDHAVTIEHVDRPAAETAFAAALRSPFVQMISRDARERIARHRSHVLVDVLGYRPASPGDPGHLSPDAVATPDSAESRRDYRRRLAACADVASLVHAAGRASLVHWVANDHLLTGDAFARFAQEPAPSLLYVHPLLFDGGTSADGRRQITIKTFGAARFIDREIHVTSSPLSVLEVWPMIAAFLENGMAEEGSIVPDGHTFGDAAERFACRVTHVPAGTPSGPFEGPLYRLDPLFSRHSGFEA